MLESEFFKENENHIPNILWGQAYDMWRSD
jgi:hypothetical protein